MSDREFDIIIYGASGFTGRLVAEYLQNEYAGSGLKWAMAGRNVEKLQSVAGEMNIEGHVAIISANSDDADSLSEKRQARGLFCLVVLTPSHLIWVFIIFKIMPSKIMAAPAPISVAVCAE